MSVDSSGMDDALAAALVEVLARSPAALARIRQLVAPEPVPADAPAYTVAALASAIGVSARAIRGAIGRGELAAVKRGGRWLIAADAVRAWTARDETRASGRSVPRRRGEDKRVLADALGRLDAPGANRRLPLPMDFA